MSYSHFTTSELRLMADTPSTPVDERRDIIDEIVRRETGDDEETPHASGEDEEAPEPQPIIIKGVDIPFVHWVKMLVLIALASIPAMIILAMIGVVVFGLLADLAKR